MRDDAVMSACRQSGRRERNAGLAAAGVNDDKLMWLFMSGAAVMDQYVNANPTVAVILGVATAVLAFMVVIWTINHWQDLLSF